MIVETIAMMTDYDAGKMTKRVCLCMLIEEWN